MFRLQERIHTVINEAQSLEKVTELRKRTDRKRTKRKRIRIRPM